MWIEGADDAITDHDGLGIAVTGRGHLPEDVLGRRVGEDAQFHFLVGRVIEGRGLVALAAAADHLAPAGFAVPPLDHRWGGAGIPAVAVGLEADGLFGRGHEVFSTIRGNGRTLHCRRQPRASRRHDTSTHRYDSHIRALLVYPNSFLESFFRFPTRTFASFSTKWRNWLAGTATVRYRYPHAVQTANAASARA